MKISPSIGRLPLAYRIVRSMYGIVRWIIPVRRRQIAFESHPDCNDSSLAIYQMMMTSEKVRNYRIYWLVDNPIAARQLLQIETPQLLCGDVDVVSKDSFYGVWVFLRSAYVFSCHKMYRYAQTGRKQTIINLWHGMPIKKIAGFIEPVAGSGQSGMYSIATSAFFAEIMAKAFSLGLDRVLVTGLPRNEWLFKSEDRYRNLRGGAKSLVVWLPTYRRTAHPGMVRADCEASAEDPLTLGRLAEIDSGLDGYDTLVLLKLHPIDVKNTQEWPKFRHIRVVTLANTNEQRLNTYKLLACADALVTDYSSVAIDFLLLRRPIGFYAPDSDSYTRGFIEPVHERIKRVGVQLRSTSELIEFLKNPGELQGASEDIEELYHSDLLTPSRDILREIGLDDLVS